MMSDDDNIEQHIAREVQKGIARAQRQHADEIADLHSLIAQCKKDLIQQNNIINRLTTEPLTFGTLLKVHSSVDKTKFKFNDEVVITDSTSQHHLSSGIIKSNDPVVDTDGCVIVSIIGDDIHAKFAIGEEGKAPAQIRLSKKADGTFAVVQSDGKPWEVQGVPDGNLRVGDPVKIKPDTKAIISKGYELTSGPICYVVGVVDDSVEVMHKGDKAIVYNPNQLTLAEGDRVVVDHGFFSVIKKLPADNANKYKLTSECTLSWDDIGGLENAKQDLRDALELPLLHPEIFEHYDVAPMRGALLYGPPGCGKTLLARASASSMASTRGKESVDSGYIYVKSPEILSKWVGETEREIRELFERARRHYRENGYKAILAFDEADAIMPQRGSRRSSDVADTIVPMFLGEMDGIDSKQTEENPIVLLLTNRADILDPAVTRAGRISNHIKVERPSEKDAINILKIHCNNIPFVDMGKKEIILTIAVADLFSKSRLLYRINNEHDFTLGDCVNGAMLENIANTAKINALHRDVVAKTATGITVEDFRFAIQKLYRDQKGINHSFDLFDFAEKIGIQSSSMKAERCFGAA